MVIKTLQGMISPPSHYGNIDKMATNSPMQIIQNTSNTNNLLHVLPPVPLSSSC